MYNNYRQPTLVLKLTNIKANIKVLPASIN